MPDSNAVGIPDFRKPFINGLIQVELTGFDGFHHHHSREGFRDRPDPIAGKFIGHPSTGNICPSVRVLVNQST